MIFRALALPALLLGLCEIAARASHYQSDSLAPPSAVLAAFAAVLMDGALLGDTAHTLLCAGVGLVIGGGVGVALGLAAGMWRAVDATISPTVEALRPMPAVVLIPLSLLIFGFGLRMEIAAVVFGCVWPMLILTRGAVASVEPGLLEVASVLRLGVTARFTKITIPAALPRILQAVRLAAGIALIVAVTAEITANPRGLGFAMMTAEQALQPDVMLAHLLWIGLLGYGINSLLMRAQRAWLGAAARQVAT